jgi:hypothetical protein
VLPLGTQFNLVMDIHLALYQKIFLETRKERSCQRKFI